MDWILEMEEKRFSFLALQVTLVDSGLLILSVKMCLHISKFSIFEHFKHGQGILCYSSGKLLEVFKILANGWILRLERGVGTGFREK